MLRESIHIFPDRTSGQHHDIKDQRSRNRKGGVALCHFIFLFSLQMMAAFDGETDYCGISLCSRPLELEISGQMEFSHSDPPPSLRLPPFLYSPSAPCALLLLIVFHLCVHISGADQIQPLEMRFQGTQFITQCSAWPLLCLSLLSWLSCNISTCTHRCKLTHFRSAHAHIFSLCSAFDKKTLNTLY